MDGTEKEDIPHMIDNLQEFILLSKKLDKMMMISLTNATLFIKHGRNIWIVSMIIVDLKII